MAGAEAARGLPLEVSHGAILGLSLRPRRPSGPSTLCPGLGLWPGHRLAAPSVSCRLLLAPFAGNSRGCSLPLRGRVRINTPRRCLNPGFDVRVWLLSWVLLTLSALWSPRPLFQDAWRETARKESCIRDAGTFTVLKLKIALRSSLCKLAFVSVRFTENTDFFSPNRRPTPAATLTDSTVIPCRVTG